MFCAVFGGLLVFALCLLQMTLTTGDARDQYIGCYRDNGSRVMGSAVLNSNMTLSTCLRKCSRTAYFGLQNGDLCFCADKYDILGLADNCNMACSGNQSEICGGEWALSVYWTNARKRYLGCYADRGAPDRVMTYVPSSVPMNVDTCAGICKTYTYLGLSWYSECWCGDVYDKYGLVLNCTSCYTPCSGDNSVMCGGNTVLSVYRVCPEGFYGLSCNLTCHCQKHPRYGPHCYRNGTCPAGCQSGWNGTACDIDIDECTLNISNCEHFCVNTRGGYNCSCRSGYTLNEDRFTCSDIDECTLNISNCEHFCVNTRGGYNCSCRSGYTLNEDRFTCSDAINACSSNNGNCSQICTKTPNSQRTCSCHAGYMLNADDRTCNDINECLVNNGNCSHVCANTVGSYTCSCEIGYALDANGMNCNDIDECAPSIGNCSQVCQNTPGSFRCSCLEGFTLSADRRTCKDVSDCPVGATVAAIVLGVVAALLAVVLIICGIRIASLQRQLNELTEQKASNVLFSSSGQAETVDPDRIYTEFQIAGDNPSNYQALDTTSVTKDEQSYEQIKQC